MKPITEKRVREIMTATDLVTGAQVREIVAETIESRVRTIVDDALLRNGIQPDKSHDAKGEATEGEISPASGEGKGK
jgi:hypothetical protein